MIGLGRMAQALLQPLLESGELSRPQLQACVASGKSMAQLLSDVQLFPQVLVNVRLKPGQDWKSSAALAQALKSVEENLGDSGRVLIRASGTEPLVRVMVEARDARLAQASAEKLAATLENEEAVRAQ